ncbi:hypothetical protein ACGFKZ_30070 [Micromonospora tulbaghiae]
MSPVDVFVIVLWLTGWVGLIVMLLARLARIVRHRGRRRPPK